MQVHKHLILRSVPPAHGPAPIYWQIAVLEDSSPYHLQFFIKTWKGDEIHNYFSRGEETPGTMTFVMHPTLSSALTEAEQMLEEATRRGGWELQANDPE